MTILSLVNQISPMMSREHQANSKHKKASNIKQMNFPSAPCFFFYFSRTVSPLSLFDLNNVTILLFFSLLISLPPFLLQTERERERERERGGGGGGGGGGIFDLFLFRCISILCVCERERERERVCVCVCV